MLHPPVRGVLHDTLAADNGLADLAAAELALVELRDGARLLLLVRHVRGVFSEGRLVLEQYTQKETL